MYNGGMEDTPKTLHIFVSETFEVVQEPQLRPEAPRVLGVPVLVIGWVQEVMCSPTLFARPPTAALSPFAVGSRAAVL